jgi:hypothetical protein
VGVERGDGAIGVGGEVGRGDRCGGIVGGVERTSLARRSVRELSHRANRASVVPAVDCQVGPRHEHGR